MRLRLAKLHGAGNDFLLADGRESGELEATLPGLVARLCHRRLGLGADGVLLLSPLPDSAARLVYWNSDGSRARFCANATRCAARFAAERWGIRRLVLHTDHARVPAWVEGNAVTLDLPAPEAVGGWIELPVGTTSVRARLLVVGTPHLVVPVEWPDFWERDLAPLGPTLRSHQALDPDGANVTFLSVSQGGIGARSWERGVEGETLACGSGVVAAALLALSEGWASSPVTIRTASGRTLTVTAGDVPPSCPTRLTGPAEWVADIEVAPELLAPG